MTVGQADKCTERAIALPVRNLFLRFQARKFWEKTTRRASASGARETSLSSIAWRVVSHRTDSRWTTLELKGSLASGRFNGGPPRLIARRMRQRPFVTLRPRIVPKQNGPSVGKGHAEAGHSQNQNRPLDWLGTE